MDFSTIEFWLSLIPAAILIGIGSLLLKNRGTLREHFQKYALALTGLTLLGLASLNTLSIFLLVMLTAWFGCKWGSNKRPKTQKLLLVVLIVLQLLPLIYYKYADFICNDLAGAQWDTLRDVLIPIGVSFYTFQLIGFCIDTLVRRQPMPKFIDFVNFASFFPQIVAGPIERRADLLPQVQNLNLSLRSTNLQAGIPYIILGLFFKLAMADNLAAAFYADYAGSNAITVWCNNLLFAFRIYFDFAGYGLTAYGIAKCMGIRLRMNFLCPYTATNITDFWRKWHTSLTLWFRDYIYFPLGGSRTKKWALNILIVFIISGIWHGAGWNFIVWGAIAGIAIVAHRSFAKTGVKLPRAIGWGLTFGLMVFAWMFFYDTTPALLEHHLNVIFTPANYDLHAFVAEITARKQPGTMVGMFIALSFAIIIVEALSARRNREEPYCYFLHPVAVGIMVLLLIQLNNPTPNPFIYFAF